MFFIKSTLFLLGSLLAVPTSQSDIQNIENQFIVKLKTNSLTKISLTNHLSWLESMLTRNTNSKIKAGILHKYDSLDTFVGYSIKAGSNAIEEIKANSQVEYVVSDGIATTFEVQPTPPSWGLDRIDQKSLPLSGSYVYPDASGSGITVYVIDTGITVGHPDFNGRASEGAYFVENDAKDGNGHGTHCSGTIAGSLYGVAKNATIVGVKVLSASGSGSFSGVIAGINWVGANALPGKSVGSMSLGGGSNQAVNDAINAVVALNIPFAIAAGNDGGKDACKVSPAGATGAYTVAASDKTDKLASFSNIGPCVEIIAPGVAITSTWLNNGFNTISGTSMATPHVAGAFAVLLSQQSFDSSQAAYTAMSAKTVSGVISGVSSSTTNSFLNIN